MFGIKDAIGLNRAKVRWRKRNPGNSTNLGLRAVGTENIVVGDYSYGTVNVLTSAANPRLTIGRFCSIARDVTFVIDDNHPTDAFSTFPFKVVVLGEPGPEALSRRGGCSLMTMSGLGTGRSFSTGYTWDRGASSRQVPLSRLTCLRTLSSTAFLQGSSGTASRLRRSSIFLTSTSPALTARGLSTTSTCCISRSKMEAHSNGSWGGFSLWKSSPLYSCSTVALAL